MPIYTSKRFQDTVIMKTLLEDNELETKSAGYEWENSDEGSPLFAMGKIPSTAAP